MLYLTGYYHKVTNEVCRKSRELLPKEQNSQASVLDEDCKWMWLWRTPKSGLPKVQRRTLRNLSGKRTEWEGLCSLQEQPIYDFPMDFLFFRARTFCGSGFFLCLHETEGIGRNEYGVAGRMGQYYQQFCVEQPVALAFSGNWYPIFRAYPVCPGAKAGGRVSEPVWRVFPPG